MDILRTAYYFLIKKRNIRNILPRNRNKKGIVVSYHYVNDRTDGFWGKLKKLKTGQFINQIKYLKKQNYSFIDLDDYLDFLYGGKDIPNNFCVLTFDDGLRDHYENVFPVLKQFGVRGYFFPLPSAMEGTILPVHKTHILLAELDDKKFVQEMNESLKILSPENFEKFKVDDIKKTNLDRQKRMEVKYQMDGVLRTNLKYNLAVMEHELKNKILSNIFKRYFGDERELVEEFYLNKNQMREMSEAGMGFGAHTLNHPRLALLGKEEQKFEIERSQKLLEEILKKDIDIFSYPFGSYDPNTFEILKELKFRGAVTIKSHFNVGIGDPFLIRRFDTIDFPR